MSPLQPSDSMLVLYGESDNGCCIVVKFKENLKDLKYSLRDEDPKTIIQLLYVKDLHKGRITRATLSPDGNYLSTSSMDGKFAIWKLELTKSIDIVSKLEHRYEICPFENEQGLVMHHWCATRMSTFCYSMGYWHVLLVLSEDNQLKLIETKNFECLQTIK